MTTPRKTIVRRRTKRLATPGALESEPYLVLLSGPEAGRWYQLLEGTVSIGRSWEDCEIIIQDTGVSRVHAVVTIRPSRGVLLRDGGSTNGTFLNGTSVGEVAQQLRDGDKIQVGDALFKFSMQTSLTAGMHEHIYSAAVRDKLTEAYNRAYLCARLDQELQAAASGGAPLSLIMFDLDYFKRVNDTWGHAAGDQVLKTVTERIQASVRVGDVFARYGGEEFVLLLPETGSAPVLRVAERLRQVIAAEPVEFGGLKIDVSASLGVATTNINSETADALLARADANLYRAKSDGRNCVRGGAS